MSASSSSSTTSLKHVRHTASSTKTGHQKLQEQQPNGRLILVATPIGNLADMSPRAIETLRTSDLILCEDTRVTAKLLRAYGVATLTQSFNDFNETGRIPAILQKLNAGACIALVSDAGTPLLSDPGYRLARQAIKDGITLEAIPGPHAASMALTLSGFPPLPYCVIGFLPPKETARLRAFQHIRSLEENGLSATLIWYEAPHRLRATLASMQNVFGSFRNVAICRELTKKFEETVRGSLADVSAFFDANAPRGEITIVLEPGVKTAPTQADCDTLLDDALQTGTSVKDAATQVAQTLDLPRKLVYRRALERASREDQSES